MHAKVRFSSSLTDSFVVVDSLVLLFVSDFFWFHVVCQLFLSTVYNPLPLAIGLSRIRRRVSVSDAVSDTVPMHSSQTESQSSGSSSYSRGVKRSATTSVDELNSTILGPESLLKRRKKVVSPAPAPAPAPPAAPSLQTSFVHNRLYDGNVMRIVLSYL
jgi:hypothetical protein